MKTFTQLPDLLRARMEFMQQNNNPEVFPSYTFDDVAKLNVPDRYVDAFCGRIPRSVLARSYTDYSIHTLKEIYDNANLTILK